MKLNNPGAEIFIPDNTPVEEAVKRTTHMAVSAHQDDIEIMAYDGILKCFGKADEWFFGVVVTDGAGSPRNGIYASYTDDDMQKIRKLEQKKAAFIGEYGAQAMLEYKSSAVKDKNNREVIEELKELIKLSKPKVIYTHNLADKHETHLGVVIKVIAALRELPAGVRPEKLYGCEVWRNLDWLNDDEKVVFDVSSHSNIAAALVEVFDSQVCGGKRYDIATAGRRLANATYCAAHSYDTSSSLIYGMDLTPLIYDINLNIIEYVQGLINRFNLDVANKLSKVL
ncbi:MAG: PIG-L family deacetylase [Clostridia bacterium]|nr:PIG-L family deacetylase [Clostridia bacterium]